MSISVLSAAKQMGNFSDWTLSNLKMQKMLYLSHMFFMGAHDGEPLLNGYFEAWDLGPVHPELYQEAKIYGARPVGNIFHKAKDVDSEMQKYLEYSFDSLSKYRASKLVEITHWQHGAWSKHYTPGIRGIVIPNEDILEEYKLRVKKAKSKSD